MKTTDTQAKQVSVTTLCGFTLDLTAEDHAGTVWTIDGFEHMGTVTDNFTGLLRARALAGIIEADCPALNDCLDHTMWEARKELGFE